MDKSLHCRNDGQPATMAVNDNGVRGAPPESIAAPILDRIRSNFRILSAYILIARRIKRIQKQLKLALQWMIY